MPAPGVTAVSATGDTPGLQISGQTTVNFTFNNNPEWQASGTNNFGVILTLGKFYNLDAGAGVTPCNMKLLAVVTPLNNGAATPYAVPLGDFAIIQSCNSGISTVAAALAASPVSEVAFQAAGGGAALPAVAGKTTRRQPERAHHRQPARVPDHPGIDRRNHVRRGRRA